MSKVLHSAGEPGATRCSEVATGSNEAQPGPDRVFLAAKAMPVLVWQATGPASSKLDREGIRARSAELATATNALAIALGEACVTDLDGWQQTHDSIEPAIVLAADLAESLRWLRLHHFADSARELEELLRAAAEFSSVGDVIHADRMTTAERLANCAARLAQDFAEALEDGAAFVPSIGSQVQGRQP